MYAGWWGVGSFSIPPKIDMQSIYGNLIVWRRTYYSGIIWHTKGPGKCVELYMSEYSGFISVLFQLTEILWDYTFLSDVTGCQKT